MADWREHIAFKKIERRRECQRQSRQVIIAGKEELSTATDTEKFKSAGLELLGAKGVRKRKKSKRGNDNDGAPVVMMADDTCFDNKYQQGKFMDSGITGISLKDAADDIGDDMPYEMDSISIDEGTDDDEHEEGDKTNITGIDIVSNYVYELKTMDGITPVNTLLTAFCLMDIDPNKRSLKENSFVIVTRKPLKFQNHIWSWIYQCDSCRNQMEIGKTSNETHLTQSEFKKLQDPCYHCLAASIVLEEFDNINYIEPSRFVDTSAEDDCEMHCPVFSLPRTSQIVVWDIERESYGILAKSRSLLQCKTCSMSSCSHTTVLQSHKDCESLPDGAKLLFSESMQQLPTQHFKSLSKDKIPHQFNSENGNKELLLLQNMSAGSISLGLQNTICQNCKNGMHMSMSIDVPLFLKVGIYTAKVPSFICETCQSNVDYDGLEDGMLNMGTFLVSHNLLRNFMYHFLYGRMPMYTYHTVYCAEIKSMGMDPRLFTYNKFKDSWYSYLALLEIDLEKGFHCEICRDTPKIVIMDATSLSFRKEMVLTWDSFLQRTKTGKVDAISRVSLFKDRVYIREKRYQSLLQRYAMGKTKKIKALDVVEFEELTTFLNDHHPELFDLFSMVNRELVLEDHIYAADNNLGTKSSPSVYSCPVVWRPFFKAISRASPICGLLHNCNMLHSAINELANGILKDQPPSEQSLTLLRNEFPLLYDLIMAFPNGKLPHEVSPVLRQMVKLSQAPFQILSELPRQTASVDNSFAHWPQLPVKRSRGVYRVDKHTKYQEIFNCKKISKGHPSLLSGIFTMFCEHEICYGFEVMLSNESPDVPFAVIFSRFQQAPDICIYDNACNLHDYCLNRQPSFFKHTRFLVDRLHWKNHTGCSLGYNMAKYPQLKDINSQINEQMNACLKRIKPQLSYMTQKNFMDHCKLFLWFRNRLTKARKGFKQE